MCVYFYTPSLTTTTNITHMLARVIQKFSPVTLYTLYYSLLQILYSHYALNLFIIFWFLFVMMCKFYATPFYTQKVTKQISNLWKSENQEEHNWLPPFILKRSEPKFFKLPLTVGYKVVACKEFNLARLVLSENRQTL